MYKNMSRNIVIGPPGTGKTTFLKNKVDKIIKGLTAIYVLLGIFLQNSSLDIFDLQIPFAPSTLLSWFFEP